MYTQGPSTLFLNQKSRSGAGDRVGPLVHRVGSPPTRRAPTHMSLEALLEAGSKATSAIDYFLERLCELSNMKTVKFISWHTQVAPAGGQNK